MGIVFVSLSVFCILFSVCFRQNSSEGVNFGTDMFGQLEGQGGVACGMMLLALYLVFDSFTSQWQSRMFTKHRVRNDRERGGGGGVFDIHA